MSTKITDDIKKLQTLLKLKNELTQKIRHATSEERAPLIEQCRVLSTKIKQLKSLRQLDPNVVKQLEHVQHMQQQTKKIKKGYIAKICKGCNNEYFGSNKSRVPIVFCKDCRAKRNNDIIEVIEIDSCNIYNDVTTAEEKLKKLKANIRLDLHKTLDKVSPTTKLPVKSVCCVSYVGKLTQTRISARDDIKNRIATGQIIFGVLVFKRGPSKNLKLANTYTEIGSKAWFNLVLPAENTSKNSKNSKNGKPNEKLFIDDSIDHVESVKFVGINSLQIKPNDNLKKMLSF